MKKIIVSIFLITFLMFFNTSYGLAKNKSINYLIKNISKEEIQKSLDSFVQMNGFWFVTAKKNKYIVSVGWKSIHDYIPFAFLFYNDVPFFTVELYETPEGTSIIIFGDSDYRGDSRGYNAGLRFSEILNHTYTGKLVNNPYQYSTYSEVKKAIAEEKKMIIGNIKDEAIKNMVNQIDPAKFVAKDPEYIENIYLIKKNIHTKNDKELIYSDNPFKECPEDNLPENYDIYQNNYQLSYDIMGNLREIRITTKNTYPQISYNYKYPSGIISNIIIKSVHNRYYIFDPTGNYLDFNPYMQEVQKKIKKNWHPKKCKTSKKVVLLFRINENGELMKYKVIEPSDNPYHNDAAISALKQSLPFAPFPSAVQKHYIDIQFTFDYNVFDNFFK